MKQAVKFTVYTLVILPCLLLSACMVPRETIDFSNIKTITAALWLKVTDYPKAMLEGPAFDRNGDLYFCDTHYEVTEGGGEIYKVSLADKLVKTIYDDPDHSGFASIKIHKDGRLFLCGFYSGDIVIMNPDGTGKKVLTASYKGRKLIPDDMIFDNDGNFYFTDYSGEIWDPTGGVYRVPSDLSRIDLVYKGLAKGNGVSLSPDGKQLWVAETLWTGSLGRTLQKFDLEKQDKASGLLVPSKVYSFPDGTGWPDSNAVDSDGNVYQAMSLGSRVIIVNPQGKAVAQVIIPSEYGDKYKGTTNVAFQPGTDTGFITASGDLGGAIFTFKALAKGLPLFSHQ